MKILRVRIRQYRSIKDLVLETDDYTALVGPNGSGKSSVLYALNWFFNGGRMSEDDLHTTVASRADGDPEDPDIDVEVTFSDLTKADRAALGMYGRGDLATFRRTWLSADGKEKMIGNSRQGPGFSAIRGAATVVVMRKLYREARKTHTDLADETNKDPMRDALAVWESDPANAHLLEDVAASDATYMFGIAGEHVIARRFRLVLVPASSIITDEVSSTGKSSAVGQLIGTLMSEAVAVARATWEANNKAELTKLRGEVVDQVKESTRQQAVRVNEMLKDLVPMATVDFVPEVPSWSIKGDATIQTDVVIDGERQEIARQGHGVQRAVLISMLHALVSGGSSSTNTEDDEDAPDPTDRPALVICIEEPEIYQHPVRARNFARVLGQWSRGAGSQVMISTHSPYFVLPDQFSSLRRFRLVAGHTEVQTTTVDEVAAAASVDSAKVVKAIEKELPRTFSEGFFADSVVFVEGDTDRVALEVLAERLGKSLDAKGTAILAMGGKGNLKVPCHLLSVLGIPVYVIADGDADGASRKHPDNKTKQAEVAGSHKAATSALIEWLPDPENVRAGEAPVSWRDPSCVTDCWALFRDDLETELAAWPEYLKALEDAGEALRSRNVAAIRSAALEADLDGLPDLLRELIGALDDFGG